MALEHLELSSTKIITHGSITRHLCEGKKRDIHKNKTKNKSIQQYCTHVDHNNNGDFKW